MYLCFMYSRRLYAKIVGGAVLIVLLSLIGSWLLITRLSFFLSFVCLLFILLITLFIIRLATRLNYKLSVFFEAMRNEDTTQHFPANPDDPFTNALYADMNHILRQLGDKHIEIEEKSLYYESILRVMTHEIRNSVTPIASLSADLLKHLDRTSISRQCEGLEVINSQVKNLTAFLDSYHRLTHLPEPEYIKQFPYRRYLLSWNGCYKPNREVNGSFTATVKLIGRQARNFKYMAMPICLLLH